MFGQSETRDRRTRAVCALGLALLVASACGKGETASSRQEQAARSPDPVASPPAADSVSFTSSQYGYSIRYPAQAEPTEATRSLGAGEPPIPGSPAVDMLRTPRGLIIVAAQRITGRASLADWTAGIEKLLRGSGLPTCAKPASRKRISVGGNPARLLVYPTCDGNYGLWVAVLDKKEAFVIWWVSEPGSEEEDRALFEKALRSFRFSPLRARSR
jgi:hypothetical protein